VYPTSCPMGAHGRSIDHAPHPIQLRRVLLKLDIRLSNLEALVGPKVDQKRHTGQVQVRLLPYACLTQPSIGPAKDRRPP
jgi:hypothetical protein